MVVEGACLEGGLNLGVDGHEEVVAVDLEVFGAARERKAAPLMGDGFERCPMGGVACADRHGEPSFVGPPAVVDGLTIRWEAQLEGGDRGVAQVLTEERGEGKAGAHVPPGDNLVGGDCLILELLVEVVDVGKPPGIVISTLRRLLSISAALKYWSCGARRWCCRAG